MSIAEAYLKLVSENTLEFLKEMWQAADDEVKDYIDKAIVLWETRNGHDVSKQFVYWYFYRKGLLIQTLDTSVVDVVITEQPQAWQDYCGGKEAALGKLIGALVKKGAAPQTAREMLKTKKEALAN